MRRPYLMIATAAALSAGGIGWVVAQESQPPAPSTAPPPSEATPPMGAPSVDTSGLPTAPVPYTTLGPSSRRSGAARAARPAQAGPVLPEDLADPPPPMKRPRHSAAILQAVDKVTAESLRFEVEVGKPVRYKTLVFTLRSCETEAEDELLRESAAHVTVTSRPKAQPGRVQPEAAQIFRGWMFASSPGLNPFEHPVYDAWLVGCKVPPPPPEAAPDPNARPPVQAAPRPRRAPSAPLPTAAADPAPEPAAQPDAEAPTPG